MLTQAGCQRRQQRLRERLAGERIDAAVITDPRDVHYLTGVLPGAFPVVLYLATEGGAWLLGPGAEGEAAVDARLTYEYHQLYTMNPDPLHCLAGVLERHLAGAPAVGRLGWQGEALPRLLGEILAARLRPDAWVEVDTLLTDIQQRKEPDEVALLRRAIACALAGYAAAERAIAPGVRELEVLAAAHRAAIAEAGEPIHVGGDFRCAAFGGPARPRPVQAGELYIIDMQTTYRGHWADLSRAYATGEPTDLQVSVYDHIAAILTEVPTQVRPGGSASALWRWIDARIREHPHLAGSGLIHHGGHGVGTRGHEAPDLNRDRDGTFAVGNVFSCEPGAYSPELRAGIRLENMFLITESGVETLSSHPLDIRAALA
jgi:Xaa-Pro dipeptidase